MKEMEKSKDVALVLSSGGPRGFAYIGAIEELASRGYRITSVSGCSVGSLVGGIYSAGGLEAFKKWLFSLDNFKVMSLLDLSISKRYLVKGEKVIDAIKKVVPDVDIEDMAIPFTAVATDLYTGEEVVFREGKLFDAIRASISIPSMFRPVKYGLHTLVDGGIVNTFPIDKVHRNGHDILVGFDVNDVDSGNIVSFLSDQESLQKRIHSIGEEAENAITSLLHDPKKSLIDKVKIAGSRGQAILRKTIENERRKKELDAIGQLEKIPVGADDNYYSILSRSFSLMNHTIAKLQAQMFKPDILVKMSFDSYDTILDYGRGEEISAKGRELMAAALDSWENDCSENIR